MYRELAQPSKKVIHKAAKSTGEFLRNKIAEAVTKSSNNKIVKTKPVIDENSRNSNSNQRNVDEIFIPPEVRRNIKRIKTSIIKMEHCKISKLLNHSTVSKLVTKK